MYEPPAWQEPYATKHDNECMITTICTIYITITAILSAYILSTLRRLQRRRRNNSQRDIYIKQVVTLLQNESSRHNRIYASSTHSRLALAEAIYIVMSHTYGNDMERLRPVMEMNNLERTLIREISIRRSANRAHLLTLLSAIPIHEQTIQHIERYTNSDDKDIRIGALTALLAAKPSEAIRTIASLDFELSPFDTARIIALLRRGLLPIAYEPLLASSNRNLRILGLAIVRSFGIEIAEKRLHKIIAAEDDVSVVSETIYTLASLGRPLGHTRIRERLAAMPAHKRKELCRHLTVEGYSLAAVRSLFTERESLYAESLINSYKRALVRAATATQ